MAAPFTVADGAVAVRADLKQYDADLKKAESSGTASGSRLAAALKRDLGRGIAAGASLAFGFAAKGLLELEKITADFRAETGATAEEAQRAGQAINEMAGRNIQPMAEIGAALTKVHTDLGLTGDEAERTTERFLRFARATKQDAGEAVVAFDDILDAWGLTAEDAQHVMDNLVASHSKYGGSIADNQRSLANLAPQLRALNLDVDDGQALLNLFSASGLDASKAQFALNSAIQKMPPGQTFDQVIRRLSAIEDPAERARVAIELFGARGGAALANVLQPGIESLDDFALSTDEMTGATETAADALDSTFGAWIQLKLKAFGSALIAAGSSFGPLLTGLASLASLGGALGLDRLVAGGFRSVAGSSIVRAAATRSGVIVSAIFMGAMGLAQRFGSMLASLPGAAAVRAGATRVGTFLGSTIGKAAGLGFASIVMVVLINELMQVVEANKQKLHEIGADIGRQVRFGSDEQLATTQAALKTAIDQVADNVRMGNVFAMDTLRDLVAQYNDVTTEVNRRAAIAAQEAANAIQAARPEARAAASALAGEIPTALEKEQMRVHAAAREWLAKPIGEQLQQIGPAGLRAGAETSLGVAAGIRQNRADIGSALDQLKEDMKNKLGPTKEVAQRVGQLFNRTLARGLKDSDPVIKAQAEGTRALIEAQLIETIKAGGKAGREIQRELEQKLRSKDPDVRRQAERTKSLIDAALKAQPPKTPGEAIGQQLNADLGKTGTTLGRTAYQLGRTIATNIVAGVRGSGIVAPSGGGSRPSRSGVQEFAEGTNYVPADMLAYLHKGEIVVPPDESERIRQGIVGGGGGDTYQNTWIMPEPTRDPFEVLDRTARYVRWGRLRPESAGG